MLFHHSSTSSRIEYKLPQLFDSYSICLPQIFYDQPIELLRVSLATMTRFDLIKGLSSDSFDFVTIQMIEEITNKLRNLEFYRFSI
jgi:hypothetical protein